MEKVIFAKYVNDRGEKYRLRTEIVKHEDGSRSVRKLPCGKYGMDRLRYIEKTCRVLTEEFSGSFLKINKVELSYDRLNIDYVEGNSLAYEVEKCEEQNDVKAYVNLVTGFADELRRIAREDFTVTDSFTEVFGEVPAGISDKSFKVSDIDLIFSNVIVKDGKYTIIDYEWTYHFSVPLGYIMYRIYKYSKKPKEVFLADEEYKRILGIDDTLIPVYERMEESFQASTVKGHAPLWRLYDTIGKGLYNPQEEMLKSAEELELRRIQIKKGYGTEREEENDYIFPMPDINGDITIDIKVDSEIKFLQIAPASRRCSVYLKEFTGFNGERYQVDWDSNGVSADKELITFDTTSPQLWTYDFREGITSLRVVLNIDYLGNTNTAKYAELQNIAKMSENKDTEISSLKEMMDSLSLVLSETKDKLASLEEERDGLAEQAKNLSEICEGRQNEINLLKACVSDKDKMLEDKDKKLEEKMQWIYQRDDVIRAKMNEISLHKKEKKRTDKISEENARTINELGEKIDGMSIELDSLKGEIESLCQKLGETEQKYQELAKEHGRVVNSTCWKITKPLRKIKRH